MLFDCHCHVQFPAYDSDRDAVISRAREAGVRMIAVGTQAATSEAGIELSKKHPNDMWAAVGFHPGHLAEQWHHDKKEQHHAEREVFDKAYFLKLAKEPEVVAIGECGLDYYRGATPSEKEEQKKVFLAQAEIAESVGKALMIHCRPSKGTDDAYEDLLRELTINNKQFTIPKILHFYVGSAAMTKKFVEAGFHFTFGGVVTFARDYDEIIKMIPSERLLLETDAPYVAPEKYRGKKNEPAYISETARTIAELKGVSYEEFAGQSSANARRVFGIK